MRVNFERERIPAFGQAIIEKSWAEASFKHIALGGTMDSRWHPAADSIIPSERSILPHYYRDIVRVSVGVDFVEVCMKDSRQLLPADRQRLMDEVAEAVQDAVLVTSGTYAAPDLANQLKRSDEFRTVKKNKKAVFTGSLVPLKGFTESDAGFNLGMSWAASAQMKPGEVALCMNGRVIAAGDVAKDTNSTVFTPSHPRYNKWEDFSKIHLITAGGTIDFVANGLDRYLPAARSGVADYLRNLNLRQHVSHTSNQRLVDSRSLADSDLEALTQQVLDSKSDKVLITMGIYGMMRLKRRLEEESFLAEKKAIIVTGSRFPLKGTELSDAPFNLGYAIGSLAKMRCGVHIALSGKVLEPNEDVLSIFTEEERDIITSQ